MNKYIRYLVIDPVIIYILILVFLGFSQKSLIYYPANTDYKICYLFQNEEKKEYKGTRFYEQKGNDNLIILFHGNAGRACDRSYIKGIFEKTGSSIIFVEYFGYSDSENDPNFKSIINDVDNIGEYIKQKKEYKNIQIVGRSIGTGPASYYAQNYKTDKLLLISPYSSLYKIGKDKYPIFPVKTIFTEDYRPEEYLSNYKNDLLIIHGTEDDIVPLKYGLELYNGLQNSNKNFLEFSKTGHNDIVGKKEVDDAIVEFLK